MLIRFISGFNFKFTVKSLFCTHAFVCSTHKCLVLIFVPKDKKNRLKHFLTRMIGLVRYVFDNIWSYLNIQINDNKLKEEREREKKDCISRWYAPRCVTYRFCTMKTSRFIVWFVVDGNNIKATFIFDGCRRVRTNI